jgi:type II secretory pathway pseudopilin PulG
MRLRKQKGQAATGEGQANTRSDPMRNLTCLLPLAPRPCRARGLSIIELLVSLTISASLLTAVAMAFSASTHAVEINDQFFRATQAARVSVNQIMTEARRCQSGLVSSNSLELTLASGQVRIYAFNSTKKELTATLMALPTPETHTMARNVSDVQFMTDGKTISMLITVTVGDNSVLLNGSAMPRRAVSYQ